MRQSRAGKHNRRSDAGCVRLLVATKRNRRQGNYPRLSVRRDGSLFGKPRATYSKLDDEDLDRAFVASIMEALNRALPLPLTESFGGVIAGRPMFMRFDVPTDPGI